MFYRKKPVVIQAFQITEETRADNSSWPEWLHVAWNKPHTEVGAVMPVMYPNSDGHDQLAVHTLEGLLRINFGDFLIRGVKGELYACKPDVFAMTYEKVEPSEEESSSCSGNCHGGCAGKC